MRGFCFFSFFLPAICLCLFLAGLHFLFCSLIWNWEVFLDRGNFIILILAWGRVLLVWFGLGFRKKIGNLWESCVCFAMEGKGEK